MNNIQAERDLSLWIDREKQKLYKEYEAYEPNVIEYGLTATSPGVDITFTIKFGRPYTYTLHEDVIVKDCYEKDVKFTLPAKIASLATAAYNWENGIAKYSR